MVNFGKSVITAKNYLRHITGDNVVIELAESVDLLVKAAKGGNG